MSDFVHDDNPQVAVINGPEGSTVVIQNDNSFATTPVGEVVAPEDIEVPDPVPYRVSTPESDKANTDQLLAEGKITEDEHKERVKEIAKIAKDSTVSPQEPEPEPKAAPMKAEKEESPKTEKK